LFPTANTQDVAPRFNLLFPRRDELHDAFAYDLVGSSIESPYERFIVVDRNIVDDQTYDALKAAGVSQLPELLRSKALTIFGVRDGLKPLAYEPITLKPSSETYIGDEEVFRRVGQLYGRAWQTTGVLPLADRDDSPVQHIAIASFATKEGEILWLCPPYGGSMRPATQLDALGSFTLGMQNHLEAKTNSAQDQWRILQVATAGFTEALEGRI